EIERDPDLGRHGRRAVLGERHHSGRSGGTRPRRICAIARLVRAKAIEWTLDGSSGGSVKGIPCSARNAACRKYHSSGSTPVILNTSLSPQSLGPSQPHGEYASAKVTLYERFLCDAWPSRMPPFWLLRACLARRTAAVQPVPSQL